MADFILLTQENRDHLAGPALQPVERQGGVFILNRVNVLADATHADHHSYLSALPYIDSNYPDFPPAIEIEE